MNNSNLPQPLHHRSRKQLEDFVLGSSWQHQDFNNHNKQKNYLQTTNQHLQLRNTAKKFQSLFEKYFRNNLLKVACDSDDIQQVSRNPIVFEQQIQVQQRSSVKNQKILAKTLNNFTLVEEPIQSSEAKTNDFFFNYRQIAREKKQKKLQFLENIQRKLQHLQKQTEYLGMAKESQQRQIKTMLNIYSQDLKGQAHKNSMMGKLNSLIYQTSPSLQTKEQPKPITAQMQNLQINAAIDDQHEYNNYLLELVDRVSGSRSRQREIAGLSRQKVKGNNSNIKNLGKTGISQNPLSKTLKKHIAMPPRPASSKKMMNTWKEPSHRKY